MLPNPARLAAATFVSLAALTGAASATPYAFSSNNVTNFTLTAITGSYTLPGTANDVGVSTNTSTDGAAVNNTIVTQPNGTLANAPTANSGPGPFPASDNFSANAGQSIGMNGVRGDGWVTNGNGQTVAEGRLVSGGPGSSSGKFAASYTITVTAGTTLQFSFKDDVLLQASTSATNAGESANASLATVDSLTNSNGVVVFTFSPDGTGPGATQGGVASSNPFNLQAGVGSVGGFPNNVVLSNTPATDTFVATTNALAAGTYLVNLRTTSQEDVEPGTAIPEPASLTLLGLGLLGMRALRRRQA